MEVLATGLYAGTAAAYTVAALAHVLHLYRHELSAMARWATRAAYMLHVLTVGFTIWETGRVPVFTVFEAVIVTSWVIMFAYVAYEVITTNQAAGPFLVPAVFILVLGSTAMPKPGPELEIFHLPASLFLWHVAVTLLGYGFFVVASVSGAMYLLLDRQLRQKSLRSMVWRMPSLETLDTWSHRLVGMGFLLLTLGLGAGIVFAELFISLPWLTDPKVLWSLMTWLLYAGYLSTRRFYGWGGRKAAWWTIGGFAGIVINYFVVNTLLSNFHRFGS